MSIFKKVKESAKSVPTPVWIAGIILPGGLTLIGLYLAWKSSRKSKQSLREFVNEMVAEERKNEQD